MWLEHKEIQLENQKKKCQVEQANRKFNKYFNKKLI